MQINGEALREIRTRTGLSVTQLADASGVDRTVISRIESGQRKGTAAQHKALADALSVSLVAIGMAVPA
jgi:transcriptional regulator with XRE-family HTH domain